MYFIVIIDIFGLVSAILFYAIFLGFFFFSLFFPPFLSSPPFTEFFEMSWFFFPLTIFPSTGLEIVYFVSVLLVVGLEILLCMLPRQKLIF